MKSSYTVCRPELLEYCNTQHQNIKYCWLATNWFVMSSCQEFNECTCDVFRPWLVFTGDFAAFVSEGLICLIPVCSIILSVCGFVSYEIPFYSDSIVRCWFLVGLEVANGFVGMFITEMVTFELDVWSWSKRQMAPTRVSFAHSRTIMASLSEPILSRRFSFISASSTMTCSVLHLATMSSLPYRFEM